GEAAKLRLAKELYESAHQRIRKLPDGLAVYPAHGAGSMCGAGMGEQQQTTLGYERLCNQYLQPLSREQFIGQILSTVPPFPDYYRRMKRLNSEGAPAADTSPLRAFNPVELHRSLDPQDIVLDLRRPEAFGGAHIPGAINIGAGPSLSMWAAW